ARINADLSNDLGNLAQRSLSMIGKNCAGKVPAPGKLTSEDETILQASDALLAECRTHHDVQAINRALDAIWKVVADANRYFAAQEPWALRKTDPERMGTVLYVTAEILRQVGILAQPYMPVSAGKLLDLLGTPADKRDFAALGPQGRLASGIALPAPAAVFPRYVEDADVSASA
ncbi:MAG: methionine--tRNA ligase, partial [Parvibaculaceae bacterium]